ncbi:tocopherol O-methyltransferase, chloroplastic [Mercurialis annua]|uniref:tocopherol O-methyltransferase, chloroplastic n=1 Tax=Mercurialis annua TaxID=3986 RepID=UPI00215F2D13|nr:tocopherol O-methyltransferase, chloroplastic [Mercurialis annua]
MSIILHPPHSPFQPIGHRSTTTCPTSSSFSNHPSSFCSRNFSSPSSRSRFSRVIVAAVTTPNDMEKKPVDTDNTLLKKGIAELYDESSGVWEDIWGEHMHHGFYDTDKDSDSDLSNHRAAQIRMIEEALRFAGVSGNF